MKTPNQLLDDIADGQEQIERLEAIKVSLNTEQENLIGNLMLLYQQYEDAKVLKATKFRRSVWRCIAL